MMETCMYFWLNNSDGNNHIERIPVAVKNIGHLFRIASEIIESDKLRLFLLSDGTRIDYNKYLESLETATELIVCTEEQIQKLSIYFDTKRYLHSKNISYPLNIQKLSIYFDTKRYLHSKNISYPLKIDYLNMTSALNMMAAAI